MAISAGEAQIKKERDERCQIVPVEGGDAGMQLFQMKIPVWQWIANDKVYHDCTLNVEVSKTGQDENADQVIASQASMSCKEITVF